MALASFFWLVFDGMKLDPIRHRYQLEYLNRAYFPYRYREMERVAAFQNRVLGKYAALRGLPFLHIASAMPRDPDLFYDPIHATYPGIRLFAWIMAQQLARSCGSALTMAVCHDPPASISRLTRLSPAMNAPRSSIVIPKRGRQPCARGSNSPTASPQ
jgi:hypothetical protein